MIDVYWWSRKIEESAEAENFGDFLVPYILDRTTTKKYRWVRPNKNKKFKFLKKRHFIIIGSILRLSTTHSVIWGAGIIYSEAVVPKAKFLAVRGPRTRQRLLDLGHNVPERFGDPALLLALFHFAMKDKKKYRLGIIPHFLDYENVVTAYRDLTDVKVINLLTNNPQEVIDQILECDLILSSSLHGIIVPHALHIPTLWMRISDKLFGDDVKFHDYFESIGIFDPPIIPYKIYSENETKEMFAVYRKESIPTKSNLDKLLLDLIQSYPFKKSKFFKNSINNYFNVNK